MGGVAHGRGFAARGRAAGNATRPCRTAHRPRGWGRRLRGCGGNEGRPQAGRGAASGRRVCRSAGLCTYTVRRQDAAVPDCLQASDDASTALNPIPGTVRPRPALARDGRRQWCVAACIAQVVGGRVYGRGQTCRHALFATLVAAMPAAPPMRVPPPMPARHRPRARPRSRDRGLRRPRRVPGRSQALARRGDLDVGRRGRCVRHLPRRIRRLPPGRPLPRGRRARRVGGVRARLPPAVHYPLAGRSGGAGGGGGGCALEWGEGEDLRRRRSGHSAKPSSTPSKLP